MPPSDCAIELVENRTSPDELVQHAGLGGAKIDVGDFDATCLGWLSGGRSQIPPDAEI